MNQKGLAPIFIVLILATLVGGYLVYQNQTKLTPSPQPTTQPSPTPDETTNWKTYTNNKYNYTLQYAPNQDLKQLSCSSDQVLQEGEDYFELNEVTSSFPPCGAGEPHAAVNIYMSNTNPGCTGTASQITVSQINSVRCDQKEYTGSYADFSLEKLTHVVVPKNGKYFIFELGISKYLTTFNQILSTFRFIP